jgi:glucosamine--fructose-6-phosphate aminotransferase (isomerizing)
VRLIEEKLLTEPDIFKAIRLAFLDLEGRNTIIILTTEGDHIIAVRNGSPLVIGKGKNEVFFASDTLSFADKTNQVIYVNNNEMTEYDNGKINLFDVKSGKKLNYKVATLDQNDFSIAKEGFDHFMIKEIVEQQYTIKEAVQYSESELQPLVEAIKKAGRVFTVGAGTASFAAGQIAYFLREYAHIPAQELKSYEMESYIDLFTKEDVILAISQSGETADTLEAIESAKKKGTKVASLVNMLGSTLTRFSDYPYFSRSGPEICVASTKAFTAQISWGYLLAMTIAGKYAPARKQISALAGKLESYFTPKLFKHIKKLAEKIATQEHFFVLGKGQNFFISLEGALKVKEITYKHFEGFAAGELKHGVIALIEEGTPVFAIVSEDNNKNDMLNAVAQVKARGAMVIGIGKKNNDLYDDFISTPEGASADSITNVIPFQLLSYFLGVYLGRSPDKPRNLAKSVTVK